MSFRIPFFGSPNPPNGFSSEFENPPPILDSFDIPQSYQMARRPNTNYQNPQMQGFSFQSLMQNLLELLFQNLTQLAQGQNSQGQPLCLFEAPQIANSIPSWMPGQQTAQNVFKKPALYLYPTKPTSIHVMLDPSIELVVDIPRYVPQVGWQVQAFPDGQLIDLQPEATDLDAVRTGEFGMEYLDMVQSTGAYPYIYWEGVQTQQPITSVDEGDWVQRQKIESYLTQLTQRLGFLTSESHDFLEYWVPTLLARPDWQSFKISVLQNEVVDQLFPMTIHPMPAQLVRVMLLVEPNPSVESLLTLKPQCLQCQPRSAQQFVAFEWGGMFVQSEAILSTLDAELMSGLSLEPYLARTMI